jgi:DNA-binding GntR family transcriptional regulator
MSTTTTDRGDEALAERPAVSDEQRDSLVLNLMLCEPSGYPWSQEELVRAIGGDWIGVSDAVARLEADGLLHRIGGFVFPTRTCRRAGELDFGA